MATQMKDSQSREVFDAESEGEDVDTYFTKAFYENGEEVPDSELDYLTETYPEILERDAFERAICAAEYMYGD